MIISHSGSFANRLIAKEQQGVVIGITSLGIFLRLAQDWIVFITGERWHGPLTLNTEGRLSQAELPRLAEEAWISQQTISFAQTINGPTIYGTSLVFDAQHAQVWYAFPRPANWLPTAERRSIFSTILELALVSGKTVPLLPLVQGDHQLPPDLVNLEQPYRNLQAFLQPLPAGAEDRFAVLLDPFIGVGKGLTPSGDDLILGCLLALARWGDQVYPHLDLPALRKNLLPKIYKKTTLLSACLIACAFEGQADERLVTALDGLAAGSLSGSEIIALLAGWGSSSGMDALVGMMLVLPSHQG